MGETPLRDNSCDMALLLADSAFAALKDAQKPGVSKWRGIKCELYSASGAHSGDLAGKAYFPEVLTNAILQNRTLWQNRFYVPCNRDLYHSLLYHLAYQKAEESLADATNPAAFSKNERYPLMLQLSQSLNQPCDFSLFDMHRLLTEQGYAIDTPRAIAYLQAQFKYRFKSRFYALLMARENLGEINMFVLRAKVIRHGFRQALLDEIAQHYTILTAKDIPWLTRFKKAKYMRGNKWRRGGWPAVAVVVFDAAPIWRTPEDRASMHPLVFNGRQFFKRDLRERVVQDGKLYHKINALHSTDNEAEAVGHFDLFFTPQEEQSIYAAAASIRANLTASGGTGLSFIVTP